MSNDLEAEVVEVGGVLNFSHVPYCCIKIPAARFKEIKNRQIEIYEGNDGIYFESVDDKGDDVGDKHIYLIWR